MFTRLCGALGIPEVADDPRFADTPSRSQHADELDELMREAIARYDLDDVVARIESAHAVVAPIRSIAEIVADPHIAARGSIVTVEDPTLGPLRMQNVVGKFSRTPGKVRTTAPACGEHNAEILIDRLGFTVEELAAAGIACERDGQRVNLGGSDGGRPERGSGERSLTEETSVGNHDEGRVPGHPRAG